MSALRREIPEGGLYPRGYGLAYHNWETNRGVCYPVPLNWIVGVWVNLWWYSPLRSVPEVMKRREKELAAAYCRGRAERSLAADREFQRGYAAGNACSVCDGPCRVPESR